MWFRATHVLNAPRLFTYLFNMLKPLYSEQMRVTDGASHFTWKLSTHIFVWRFQNSIFFHNSLEELHKHVGPDLLPEEYGGTLGPFSNEDILAAIRKHENHFKEVQEMLDKSKNKDKK